MHQRASHIGLVALALGLCLLPSAGRGQALTPKTPAEQVGNKAQNLLKQVDESPQLDDGLKAKLKELYEQTLREVETAKASVATAAGFEQTVRSAPQDLQRAKEELARPPAGPKTVPADLTLPQLEQEISKKETRLNEAKAELAELEAEPKKRASFRAKFPAAVSAAKDLLAEIDKQLQAAAGNEEPSQVVAARRQLLVARKRAAEAEVLAWERRIAAYEATAELLPLRRDLAARKAAQNEKEIAQWREVLNARRQQEADKQVEHAQREAAQAHPALRKLAEENAELAEMRKGLAQRIAETTQQLDQTLQRLGALKEQFKRVQEKVETVGLTNAIGMLLRKQRDALPNLHAYRRSISARQAAIREGQLALLQLQDRRSELANLDLRVQAVLRGLGEGAAERRQQEAAVRELLKTEKEYLDALIGDHNSNFDKLVDLDNAQRQLIQETEACGRYIDERVLWIGSAPVLGLADLRHAGDALWWLARPEGWSDLGRTLLTDAWNNPVPPLLALAVLVPLVWSRRRLRARLHEIGERTARANCCRFLPTLEALGTTLLLSLMVPGVLWYLAWRLSAELDAAQWCKAVGAGLASAAKVYLLLDVVRQICHGRGLGGAHFDWDIASLQALRRQLKWLLVVGLPAAFLVAVMDAQENDRWRDSLGRMSFAIAAVFFSLFLQRVLRPSGSVFEAVLADRRGGWLDRFRYAWYPLAVLHPLALAGAAVAGYYYTSQQIGHRVFLTLNLLLGLVLLRALLLRWALVNRRKLAIEQARQRRAAQAETNPGGETGIAPGVASPAELNRDLAVINSQTRRLIEYSLLLAGILIQWLVWVDVLPALRIFNGVHLWQTGITLADLGLAVLALATTVIAAKNLPGLLEMGLLQHLPMDAGVRYAVATVSRYVITVVGVLLACNLIGLAWSKVQWLLAAMSLGLGFGLQEIFANFISGLIILFERPVRVGDVVTVHDVTGIVSRIHMRATTITNWDRKELIIPNKEFITGRVLNWTLSDEVNRVVIEVGIAYGSDTERASQLLLKAAREHPVVLDDPPPKVALEAFGPSALSFVLRCYLPNLDNRTEVIHQLHMAIDRALREAGIEIAYPQQDVHVRSVNVAPDLLQAAAAGSNAGPALQVAAGDDPSGPLKRQVA